MSTITWDRINNDVENIIFWIIINITKLMKL